MNWNHKLKVAATWVALSLPWIGAASAQTVQQSGTVTRNHIPVWITSGVIGDGGSSADSPISSIGVTNNGGSGICVNSARQTAAGYVALCFGSSTTGPATISLQNFGTAAAQNLQFVINGTTFPFPGSLANITIGTTPVVGGTSSQCLFVSGGVVGQQACTLSAITSLTGDVTATGPGVSATTLATVNANTGTFGSGAVVPVITVNGKGLITSVSTSTLAITVGSTVVAAGSTNGMLYDNGGVLGNLSTLASAVLTTDISGVPLMRTTLPSALTIPTPTFTGTLTLPDAATWTLTGITHVVAISVGSAALPASGRVNVSDQYQVNGSQIAASNLSNGTTGSGSVVLSTSPTMAGTWAGAVTFSGALTLSGNDTFSAQAIHTGTSAPASAAGNTVVMGTIVAPTLTNNGQTFLFNTTVNGAVVEGAGSTYDVAILNKSGAVAIGIGTGTTVPVLPGLAAGTCASGLSIDAGNNVVKTSCPGAASSIQVGATTITSGSSGRIEFNNVGTLGELAANGGTTVSSTNLQQDPNYGGFANQNCTITASVAGNNLTVALKDNAGSDPSATSPCFVNFGNATIGTGSTSSVAVAAATSFVANAGSTFGSTNTAVTCRAAASCPFKLWVVAINNAGTVVLGVVDLTNGAGTLPLNEATLLTTTACSACATATTIGTTYSTAAQTSKSFKILGYLEWGSGLVTAGTYASAPTSIRNMGPGVKKPNEIVQTQINTLVNSATLTAAATFANAITQTVSPTLASNNIRATAMGDLTIGISLVGGAIALRVGTTSLNPTQTLTGNTNATMVSPASQMVLDTPGTTGSTSYVWSVKGDGTHNAGLCTVTAATDGCTLMIEEIQG